MKSFTFTAKLSHASLALAMPDLGLYDDMDALLSPAEPRSRESASVRTSLLPTLMPRLDPAAASRSSAPGSRSGGARSSASAWLLTGAGAVPLGGGALRGWIRKLREPGQGLTCARK